MGWSKIEGNQSKWLREARTSTEIDSESRQEILTLLNTKLPTGEPDYGAINLAGSLLGLAKEGTDPKFKSRRATEALFNTILAQPGRRQLGIGVGPATRESFLLGGPAGFSMRR